MIFVFVKQGIAGFLFCKCIKGFFSISKKKTEYKMTDNSDSVLEDVCLQLSSNPHTLQDLSEGIHAVRNRFQNYNDALATDSEIIGFVVEQFVVEFLKEHLNDFQYHQTSVSDFIYRDIKFAFRVIFGKLHLHLERPNRKLASPSYKHFSWKNPVLLLNLKKENWGKSTHADVSGCCKERTESAELFCVEESLSNQILNEGFYMLSGDDIREMSTAADSFQRNILMDDVLGSCLRAAIDKKRFVALSIALGLKKFTLSRGIQWK